MASFLHVTLLLCFLCMCDGQTLAVQGQTLALQLSADEQTQLKHRQQFALSSLSHHIYRVSQEEWTKLQESAPYVKIYRYNPKHLCP